jgi:hypothetical protein
MIDIKPPPLMRGNQNLVVSPVQLVLPKPYAPWQRELIESDVKLQVYALGTKAGKTLGASIRLIRRSFLKPIEQDALLRIVAPYLRQSAITFRYINRLVPPELRMTDNLPAEVTLHAIEEWRRFTLDRSEQRRTMQWPHNMCRIECCHTQDAEANEGERVADQIFDEAAKAKEQAYASIMSTTTQTGGSTVLISTPRGKGWFYKVAMECLEEEQWCLKKGVPVTKIFRTVPTWTSPFVDKQIIENAKKTLPDRLFRQLYGAEFTDSGSVLTELGSAFKDAHDFSFEDFHFEKDHDSAMIFVGVDWAKTIDSTVMIALNDKGKMIAWRRIQKLSYPQQVQMLFDFLAKVTENGGSQLDTGDTFVLHDKTGVGEAVDDIIRASNTRGWNIEPIKWNNSNKELFVNDLILSLEEHRLTLLPWHYLHSEMQSFEIETSASGNPIYGAPDGMHDDTVMSLVLANNLMRNHTRSSHSTPIVVDSLRNQIESIYYTDSWEDRT